MRAGQRADEDRALAPTSHSLPKLTRRHLLATGGASGAAAVVALNPALAAAADAVLADPAYLRRASYGPLVGQSFAIDWWGSSGTLWLVAVNDLADPALAGRDDAFSLVFAGDPGLALGDGPTTLSQRALGRFQLHVGAIEPAAGAQAYEAVFNRSVGANRPTAPRPTAQDPAPEPAVHAHHRIVSRVSGRRTAKGARFEVVLPERSRARNAYGWLFRGERFVGALSPTPVHDHRALLKLHAGRRPRRGRYTLVVGTGRADGALARVPVELA